MPENDTASPAQSHGGAGHHPIHKTLTSVSNLANLLPTGTVLAFETLTPSFTNRGSCRVSNEYLTAALIGLCSIICFLSTFTDSFTAKNGKVYFGIATFKGIFVFREGDDLEELQSHAQDMKDRHMKHEKLKINLPDFVHAFVSLFAFLAYALSDTDLQKCFCPRGDVNLDVFVKNLPLAAGFLASLIFTIFPTNRRGIGYADVSTKSK